MKDTVYTEDVEEAAAWIRRGGGVAFPTETVYGLGASVFDEAAIAGIFAAKGRPADNPLIVHLADPADIGQVAAAVPPTAQRLLDAFSPGPLTLVLPRHPAVPLAATAGLETVGVRMPAHALAQAFLRACGVPLVAPSANRSGRPSPTTWQAVRDDLDGRIDAVLCGDPTDVGLESTVVEATSDVPLVLRAGAVTLEALQAVVPATRMYVPTVGEAARSPGLRHRHYAPAARVVLVADAAHAPPAPDAAFLGLTPPTPGFGQTAVYPDVAAYARDLFARLRAADAAGLTTVYAQTVPETGLGRALMDRLRRAAEG